MDDLRHGLYLGSKEFSKECIQRIKEEEHREKPQSRLLLENRDIQSVVFNILERLGEKDPDAVLNSKRKRRPNRDVAIYILYQLGEYRNEEIGKVFGVGYTAVTGAVKRGQKYLDSDRRLAKAVKEMTNDI